MEKRPLGKTDIKVVPFMFGGNVFGWTADQNTSFGLLDAFIDSGFDFIDTADVYSAWAHDGIGGQSESVIGNWLKRKGGRDKFILATKVGKPVAPGKKGLSAAYIKQAVEDSLKRLQTDYIDLYQSHDDDQETPLEETLGAYADLIKEGKVRIIGASNYKADRLEEALKVSKTHNLPAYQTLQPEYNLYGREDYEKNLESICDENGLGVVTYFSLASGFLTGKYRSEADLNKSKRGGGIKKYLNPRGLSILDALNKAAQEYSSTPAAIALAWVIARPSITAPIASATSVQQLHELAKAVEIKLSAETMAALTQASAY
jgi:aryl-alcohol dehydrogenase-like predicted oxidoreductase